MTKKYEVELFEGSWGYQIGEYDTIEEAEEEYEKWNNSKELYEERKSRLYSNGTWYYKPWTRQGAYKIQQTESISVYLNELTYDEDHHLIEYEDGSPVLTIKSIYYSGSDFLERYKKENESDDED